MAILSVRYAAPYVAPYVTPYVAPSSPHGYKAKSADVLDGHKIVCTSTFTPNLFGLLEHN